jgi:hypothetical protein
MRHPAQWHSVLMLSVAKYVIYAECHFAACHNAECHYAACHNAECHYAECHYAEFIMLNGYASKNLSKITIAINGAMTLSITTLTITIAIIRE